MKLLVNKCGLFIIFYLLLCTFSSSIWFFWDKYNGKNANYIYLKSSVFLDMWCAYYPFWLISLLNLTWWLLHLRQDRHIANMGYWPKYRKVSSVLATSHKVLCQESKVCTLEIIHFSSPLLLLLWSKPQPLLLKLL